MKKVLPKIGAKPLLAKLLFALTLLAGTAAYTQEYTQEYSSAGVASAHPAATAAGIKMLEMGGNAFDAAIAITATIAVVEPAGSGLGGGGFWLLHQAKTGESVMLDGREKAPIRATQNMYLDEQGNVIADISIDGALSAGIPGEPAALAWLAENYAALPLSTTLQPAIDAARNGFAVTPGYQNLVEWRKDVLLQNPAAAEVFLHDGAVPVLGSLIIQPDLANTLEILAAQGHSGFYQGEIANALVKGVQDAGGIWSLEDLAQYQIVLRQPIVFDYRNIKVTSATLPSSGGLVLATSLNILENYDLTNMSETELIHITVEAMRRAYRDRAEFMGDTDFVEVPIEMLQSQSYANGLNQSIRVDRASKSAELAPTYRDSEKGQDTTHFSVIDHAGNRVSATLSINYPFGSGVMPAGTGVLLNDEMDDFSAKPATPNVYGLVGAQANAIAPGKRMLSSMSPTFVESDDRVLIVGTPGGSRIISMLLLAILEFEQGGEVESIVNRRRFHHQYLPDSIQFEKNSFNNSVVSELANLGHKLKEFNGTWGNMHAVMLHKLERKVSAASDKRGEGRASVIP